MDDENFNRIMEGLDEAARFVRGEKVPALKVHIPAEIDVKAIRAKLELSQSQFAKRFGFSVASVRDWEQGRRVPERGVRSYLKVIAADPKAVERALEGA